MLTGQNLAHHDPTKDNHDGSGRTTPTTATASEESDSANSSPTAPPIIMDNPTTKARLLQEIVLTNKTDGNNYKKLVTVIGTGYVGLPLCVLLKESGHAVIGYDKNPDRVSSLKNGISFIDDVADEELEGMTFTSNPEDIVDSDVFIICVPTPVKEQDKSPDLGIVQAVKQTLEQVAKPGSLIILESTVGVGDTRSVFGQMCHERGIYLAHSPERIDPGRKFPALKDIPKIVGAVDDDSKQKAVDFYETVFSQVVPVRNSEHSEAVKLLENSYRAVNISFINEFANFCDVSGLDVNDIVDGASTKPYGFSPFRSWIGVGGHCIPVDPHFLMSSSPPDHDEKKVWPILSTTMEAMHERPRKLAQERFDNKKQMQRVLVCGVSYKPNVSDTRDAPQHAFVEALKDLGVQVDFFDPFVQVFQNLKKIEELLDEAVESYDSVFVMHKHDMCADLLESFRGRNNVEFFG